MCVRVCVCVQADLQEKEQQKQQCMDETRDKKTGLESAVELKRELQARKQQELRSLRQQLQHLDGSSGRLQELENELAKHVSKSCCKSRNTHTNTRAATISRFID